MHCLPKWYKTHFLVCLICLNKAVLGLVLFVLEEAALTS